jgi:fumarate reductase subunit C
MSEIKSELYPGATKGGGKKSSAYLKAKGILRSEIISGGTGFLLSGFILGHLVFESSILLGRDAYDTMAHLLEKTLPIAQVMIFVITVAFFFHFVYASRKVPGKLKDRKRMLELGISLKKSKRMWKQPKNDITHKRHRETSLWIWQVRTGMTVLAMGAFHLFLVMWNLFTDMGYADAAGFTAKISSSRVESGLWILYLLLGIAVVTHMSIGLYRLSVKWITDSLLTRKSAFLICTIIFLVYLALNIAAVMGLAGKLTLL